MNVRNLLTALLVLGVAASFALPAFTEEPEAPAQPSDPMTEAWAAHAKPGPNHEWMGFMVGSWDVAAKLWMGPGEPQESKGHTEAKWFLGKRFVRSDYAGEMAPGQAFHGEATMGFNNATQQYETAWVDEMSTSIARATGTREGDVLTMTGKSAVPMMGEVAFRTLYTRKSDDEYLMEDYWTIEGMGEMKVMELTYTRAAE